MPHESTRYDSSYIDTNGATSTSYLDEEQQEENPMIKHNKINLEMPSQQMTRSTNSQLQDADEDSDEQDDLPAKSSDLSPEEELNFEFLDMAASR